MALTVTRHKDFMRKTCDFLWKSTQNAYKIGEYWEHIEDYEQRGTCPICNEQEDIEHILTTCRAKPRELTWKLANELWSNRHNSALPTRLGDVLGCGLAKFTKNGKPNKGKNRCRDQQSGIKNTMISDSTNCLLYRVSGFSIPS